MTKGQEIYVEGRLETSSWDDKETGKKMYRTEIVMENFEFGSKPAGGGQNNNNQQNQTPAAAPEQPKEEEIPTINLDDEADEVKIEDVPF